MKCIVIRVITLLFLKSGFGYIDHKVTLDPECDANTDIHYAVLLMIRNVNRMTDTCTGAIFSPSIVVTTGLCCHSAHFIKVFAFYSFAEQRWEQKRKSKSTSVLQKDPNIEVGDDLCVITLEKPLDLTPIDNNVTIFKDKLDENSVLDVIVFLRTSGGKNDSLNFMISCRLAESEAFRKCGSYYRSKLNQTNMWLYCITNGFTWKDTCIGIGGAVIQFRNEIVGVGKEFLENCNTAQYTFYHKLETDDNEKFIEMVMNRGWKTTEDYRGEILMFLVLVTNI